MIETETYESLVCVRVTVDVVEVDAGSSDAYSAIEPADLVLLVGIFGNISDDDLFRTIAVSSQVCRAGAIVVWSRSRDAENLGDRNPQIRAAFAAADFAELDYQALERGSLPAVGVERYDGTPRPLDLKTRWFTFIR